MLKLSLHHTSLGVHLKRERKYRQLTQSNLAQQAQVAIPTIRSLENGQGTLSSFWQVLDVLNLDIVGRNLPQGSILASKLLVWRTVSLDTALGIVADRRC